MNQLHRLIYIIKKTLVFKAFSNKITIINGFIVPSTVCTVVKP